MSQPASDDGEEGENERPGVYRANLSDEERRELYRVEMKEPRGEPFDLTYFSQLPGAVIRGIKRLRW